MKTAKAAQALKRLWLLGLPTCLFIAWAITSTPSRAQGLSMFAASSMADVLGDALRRYQAVSGDKVTASYAASSVLARQIERAAPADVFVSADQVWMDYLSKASMLEESTRVVLAGNRIVLIAPRTSALELKIESGFGLAAALGGSRLAIGDPSHVPAGRYARDALAALGVWDAVKSRIAATENVRSALNLVVRGEAPLGIVYRTDAIATPAVRIVGTFPARTHAPIEYPAAVLRNTKHPEAARALIRFLRSDEAQAVFARHGFAPAR